MVGTANPSALTPKEVGLLRWRKKEETRYFLEDEARLDLEDRLEIYKLNKQGAKLARIIGEKTVELADLMIAVSVDVADTVSPRRIINLPSSDPEYDERIVITGLDTRLRQCPPSEAANFLVQYQEREIDDAMPYPGAFNNSDVGSSYVLGLHTISSGDWGYSGLVRVEDILDRHQDVRRAILKNALDPDLNSEIAAALSPATTETVA